MYIVEIINPETAGLAYSPAVFSDQDEAEEYLAEVCGDTPGLEGIIVSVLLEKSLGDKRMILVYADIMYHT